MALFKRKNKNIETPIDSVTSDQDNKKLFKTSEQYAKEELETVEAISQSYERTNVNNMIIETHDAKFNNIVLEGDYIDYNYLSLQLFITNSKLKYEDYRAIVKELFDFINYHLHQGIAFSFGDEVTVHTIEIRGLKRKMIRFPKTSKKGVISEREYQVEGLYIDVRSANELGAYEYVLENITPSITKLLNAGYRIKIGPFILLKANNEVIVVSSKDFVINTPELTTDRIKLQPEDSSMDDVKLFSTQQKSVDVVDKDETIKEPEVVQEDHVHNPVIKDVEEQPKEEVKADEVGEKSNFNPKVVDSRNPLDMPEEKEANKLKYEDVFKDDKDAIVLVAEQEAKPEETSEVNEEPKAEEPKEDSKVEEPKEEPKAEESKEEAKPADPFAGISLGNAAKKPAPKPKKEAKPAPKTKPAPATESKDEKSSQNRIKYISRHPQGGWKISNEKDGKAMKILGTQKEAIVYASTIGTTESILIQRSSGWKPVSGWDAPAMKDAQKKTAAAKKRGLTPGEAKNRATQSAIKAENEKK